MVAAIYNILFYVTFLIKSINLNQQFDRNQKRSFVKFKPDARSIDF